LLEEFLLLFVVRDCLVHISAQKQKSAGLVCSYGIR
jgi:hypothetical protein